MTSSPLSALVSQIQSLLSTTPSRPVLVALDGRCGSGKSTLANLLAQRFPDSMVVHTDDFYLPVNQRIPHWETVPAANMDLERFRTEVLLPARAGQEVLYRRWSCPKSCFLASCRLSPHRLVLVDGSYSQHPQLSDLYDCKIFVTCNPEEQNRRLMAREGERFAMFAHRWIPLEEGYFAQYKIEAAADWRIDTAQQPLPVTF